MIIPGANLLTICNLNYTFLSRPLDTDYTADFCLAVPARSIAKVLGPGKDPESATINYTLTLPKRKQDIMKSMLGYGNGDFDSGSE